MGGRCANIVDRVYIMLKRGKIFMFCKFCGKNIPDGSATCPSCGKQLNEAKVITQQQIVGLQLPKSLGIGLALSFLFGPLGLLYSSVKYAIILIAVDILSWMLLIGGAGNGDGKFIGLFFIFLPLSWIASMVLSWHAITKYNDNVRKGKLNRDID